MVWRLLFCLLLLGGLAGCSNNGKPAGTDTRPELKPRPAPASPGGPGQSDKGAGTQ